MRAFWNLVYKDILVLIRDKGGLAMLFIMPMALVMIMTMRMVVIVFVIMTVSTVV